MLVGVILRAQSRECLLLYPGLEWRHLVKADLVVLTLQPAPSLCWAFPFLSVVETQVCGCGERHTSVVFSHVASAYTAVGLLLLVKTFFLSFVTHYRLAYIMY